MDILSICIFLLGVLFVVGALIVFFKNDCRKIFKELRTTKKINLKEDTEDKLLDIYYKKKELPIAYNNDLNRKMGEIKRKGSYRLAEDDTAYLVFKEKEINKNIVKGSVPSETEILNEGENIEETEILNTEDL